MQMSASHVSGPFHSENGFVGDVDGDVNGDVTGDINATAATGESGAGAVGTGAVISISRREENRTIITETKFDITGLYVLGTAANEVIGLEAGGIAFIGQNDESLNGIIYRAELACLVAPTGSATITTDIDIATAVSAILEEGGDGTAARLINAGTSVVGTIVVNNTPTVTADHYFYIVGADTVATTGTYTAGQYILRTYGHAVLS